jgi:hypothetical protein
MKRKKVWFIGLGMLVATILIFSGHQESTSTLNLAVRAQESPQIIAGRSGVTSSPFLTPPPPPKPQVTGEILSLNEDNTAPTPGPSPKPSAEATAAPTPGPKPNPTSEAEATTAPKSTPTATPTPKPEVSPDPGVPVAPATTTNTSLEKISPSTLPLSGEPYKDPQGQFEVGILENYNVSAIADAPLMESPDGNMAYSVVVKPKITNEQFSNQALAQMAVNQFQQGEGFQPDELKVLADGEILIPWTGTVTIGRNSQPISGSILVRQNSEKILMLLLSSTENASEDISSAIATLSNSLKSL